MNDNVVLFFLGFWVFTSLVVGALGGDRKVGFFAPFVVSLILSPIVGVVVVLSSITNLELEFRTTLIKYLKEIKNLNEREVLVNDNTRNESIIRNNESSNTIELLGKLVDLKDKGVMNLIEFEEQKRRILNNSNLSSL